MSVVQRVATSVADTMPTYITLVDFTQKGIETIADAPARLDDAKAAAADLGGEMRSFHLTMGSHDIVIVSEFPDDERYAKWVLASTRRGTVSTETLKAFTESEYRDIVAGLP